MITRQSWKNRNSPAGLDNVSPVGNKMLSMNLKSWIELERGRGTALAKALDVPPSFITKMVSGEKSIPVHHMAAIESFTGGSVTRRDMRPDDFGRIWPELADVPTPMGHQQIPTPATQEA